MSKLTLSVDDRVVSRAKQYAKRCGVSISKLVESYLSQVVGPLPATDTPVLRLVSVKKGRHSGLLEALGRQISMRKPEGDLPLLVTDVERT